MSAKSRSRILRLRKGFVACFQDLKYTVKSGVYSKLHDTIMNLLRFFLIKKDLQRIFPGGAAEVALYPLPSLSIAA